MTDLSSVTLGQARLGWELFCPPVVRLVQTRAMVDLYRLRECMPNLCLWLSCFICLLFGHGDCQAAVEEHEEDADDGKDHEDHQSSLPEFDEKENVILIA